MPRPEKVRLGEILLQQNLLTEQDPPALYIGERQYYTALRSDIVGFQPNPLYLDAYNFYGMKSAGVGGQLRPRRRLYARLRLNTWFS